MTRRGRHLGRHLVRRPHGAESDRSMRRFVVNCSLVVAIDGRVGPLRRVPAHESGTEVLVRDDDGDHLVAEGADRFACEIMESIRLDSADCLR